MGFMGTMKPMRNYAAAPKKSTSVSLAESLLAEAKALGVNVSQAAEEGLASAVARQRREQWLAENQEAFKSANEEFERRGLLLP